MLSIVALCAGIATTATADDAKLDVDVDVDLSTMLGVGVGLSPNSTVMYGVPWLSLHTDFVFDDSWYVGGGFAGFTFIDPRFALVEDPLSRGVLDFTARVGLVMFEQEPMQVRGDLGVLLGVYEQDPEDAPPGIYLYPSIGTVGTLRADWTIAGGVFVHVGGAGTIILAPFGLIEFVPQMVFGAGWRF